MNVLSTDIVEGLYRLQWFYLLYFILINSVYTLLNLLALAFLRNYTAERDMAEVPPFYAAFAPPISIIVPAYNEERTIEASILTLLQITYPEYEIIVVNDGSQDETLDVLKERFSLIPCPPRYLQPISTQAVRTIFQSTRYHHLTVIDKENGGKADSLNAGISVSRHDLLCCVDADSLLQSDSLLRIVQPFIEDPDTIAAGGSIRVANGCRMEGGFITRVLLPRNPLALVQVMEYLRGFLFGRLGWSPLNALLIISGAFSIFRKQALLAVGGYRTDTVGEDMELVVRLHHHYLLKRQPYRITFVPDPVCWTEVPEDLKTLKNQRCRWQRGLGESLFFHWRLMFHAHSGWVGWLAMPFMLVFEFLSPVVEISGYLFFLIGYGLGYVLDSAFFAFCLLSIGFGLLLSLSALVLEEMSFHLYTKPTETLRLLFALLLENVGYRQLTLVWRIYGVWQWLMQKKGWGEMKRAQRA